MDLNFLPASEIQKSTGPRQAQGSILALRRGNPCQRKLRGLILQGVMPKSGY